VHVDDDDETFGEIVASVLNTPELATQEEPMHMIGLVMIKVLNKMDIDVKTAHVLDILSESDGQPPYPERVFEAVQMSDSTNFNLYTKKLPTVHLDYWRRMWEIFVDKALKISGSDLQDDIECMRQNLDEAGVAYSSKGLSVLSRNTPQRGNGIYSQVTSIERNDRLPPKLNISTSDVDSKVNRNNHEKHRDPLEVPFESRLSRCESLATNHRSENSSPSWFVSLMVLSLAFLGWYWWHSIPGI
jgi:hypothetical protein